MHALSEQKVGAKQRAAAPTPNNAKSCPRCPHCRCCFRHSHTAGRTRASLCGRVRQSRAGWRDGRYFPRHFGRRNRNSRAKCRVGHMRQRDVAGRFLVRARESRAKIRPADARKRERPQPTQCPQLICDLWRAKSQFPVVTILLPNVQTPADPKSRPPGSSSPQSPSPTE